MPEVPFSEGTLSSIGTVPAPAQSRRQLPLEQSIREAWGHATAKGRLTVGTEARMTLRARRARKTPLTLGLMNEETVHQNDDLWHGTRLGKETRWLVELTARRLEFAGATQKAVLRTDTRKHWPEDIQQHTSTATGGGTT